MPCGSYAHRVAISNHRILAVDNESVTFRYRDRADGDRVKTRRLPVDVFIGRFLSHVLPERFRRIRHFGLLSNRTKKRDLARCRELLPAPAPVSPVAPAPNATRDAMLALTGIDIRRCPACATGTLQRVAMLPARRFAPIDSPSIRGPPAPV